MNELFEQISALIASFEKDAEAQVKNSNKAAGARARKTSIELGKLLKEFRTKSIEASK